jgi:hypothetical protein
MAFALARGRPAGKNGADSNRMIHEPPFRTPAPCRATLHAPPRRLCHHRRGRRHSRHVPGRTVAGTAVARRRDRPRREPAIRACPRGDGGNRIRIHGIRRLGMFHRFTYMPEYDLHAQKQCHIYTARLGPRRSEPTEDGHSAVFLPWEVACERLAVSGDRHFVAQWMQAASLATAAVVFHEKGGGIVGEIRPHPTSARDPPPCVRSSPRRAPCRVCGKARSTRPLRGTRPQQADIPSTRPNTAGACLPTAGETRTCRNARPPAGRSACPRSRAARHRPPDAARGVGDGPPAPSGRFPCAGQDSQGRA